jgi:hypothetical protein
LQAITNALSAAVDVALTVNGESVRLVAATVTEPAKFIGQEEQGTRQLFTAVVKLALRQ